MVKLDGKRHLKAIKRQETGRFVSIGHRQRLFDSNKLFGGSLLLDARRLNQKYEWPSTAVHNRYFRGAELDNRVVNAQSRHRGQEVLHRRDFYVTLDQGGGQRGLADVLSFGLYLNHRVEIHPAKANPGINRRRQKGQINLLACVQSDAGGANGVLQGTLSDHYCILPTLVLLLTSPKQLRRTCRNQIVLNRPTLLKTAQKHHCSVPYPHLKKRAWRQKGSRSPAGRRIRPPERGGASP